MGFRRLVPTIAAAMALLPAVHARAAVICVSQAGPPCEPSIQAGVDRASAGDVVMIERGVYFENVIVPDSKTGLQIVGRGRARTIVDPAPYADKGIVGTNIGFILRAPGVRIRALTIRNGLVGVRVQREDTTIEDVRFKSTVQGIIVLDSVPRTQILSCDFRGGHEGVVANRTIGTTLTSNKFAAMDLGVLASGQSSGMRITGNRFDHGRNGVLVESADAVVESNRMRYHTGFGAFLLGGNPIAQQNRVEGAQRGIWVQCVGSCDRASVASNVVTGARELGISMSADTAGAVVQDNRVRRALIGLQLDGRQIRAEGNRIANTGYVGTVGLDNVRGDCFQVYGESHELLRNTVTGCTDSGILVFAVTSRLEGNEARGTAENGFTIDGRVSGASHNVLFGNTAIGNAAQGIAIVNRAFATTVTGNVATGNRTDFCDAGIQTMVSGNTFGTVGPCAILH